ncbi:MAG: HAD hydrolase-like protein [Candidatus Coprovivens sp.]
MTLGIDIDDTLTNTKEKQKNIWKKYIKKYPTDKYTEKLPDNINSFNDEYISKFWDENRYELSYTTTFKNNASDILKKLHEEGYKICIITSRPDNKYKNLKKELINWFKENNIYTDKIYTNIRNKGIFCKENNIDILIDDSINHIEEAINNNIKAILFNNKKDYKNYQVNNWNDLYQTIKILSE